MTAGNEAVEKINKFISDWYDEYIYDENDQNHYERTDQLKNCARYSITGNNVKVYLDMRRLRSSTQNKGKGWQAHRSFDGEDFTYGLIDFLENGSSNGNNGAKYNPRRNDFGIHFLEQTQDWINNYISKEVQKKIEIITNYKEK